VSVANLADVWKKDFFGCNPPLLVVSDLDSIDIRRYRAAGCVCYR